MENKQCAAVLPERKILLVDDHPVFRLGMSELINGAEGLVVCGDAENEKDALGQINRLRPDLVVVDITLKDSDGISLIKQISSLYPGLPVLVVSMHDESLYAERALIAGARGYIMKQEATLSIVGAIREVLSGKIYASQMLKENFFLRHLDPAYSQKDDPVRMLTDRELEVFRLFAQGCSSKEIADKLTLSIKTIGTYRERIKEKLNLKHFNELISYATQYMKNSETKK